MDEKNNIDDAPELVWNNEPAEKPLLGDNRGASDAAAIAQTNNVSTVPIKPIATDGLVPEPKKIETKAPVKTYYHAVQDAMKDGQGGTMASVLAEVRARDQEKENKSVLSKKNLLFLGLGVLLIIGALLILWQVFGSRVNSLVPIEQGAEIQSLVPADAHVAIDITDASYSKIVALTKQAIEENGGEFQNLTHLYFTKDTPRGPARVLLGTLLSDLGIDLPADLARGIRNDFMFGMYTTTTDHPFLVFDVDSFDRAFFGMQEWETTMLDDIKGIFAIREEYLLPGAYTRPFEEQLVINKQMRVLSVPQIIEVEEEVPVESVAADFVNFFGSNITFDITEEDLAIAQGEGVTFEGMDNLNPVQLAEMIVGDSEPTYATRIVKKESEAEPILFYTFLDEKILVLTTSQDVIAEINTRLAERQLFE